MKKHHIFIAIAALVLTCSGNIKNVIAFAHDKSLLFNLPLVLYTLVSMGMEFVAVFLFGRWAHSLMVKKEGPGNKTKPNSPSEANAEILPVYQTTVFRLAFVLGFICCVVCLSGFFLALILGYYKSLVALFLCLLLFTAATALFRLVVVGKNPARYRNISLAVIVAGCLAALYFLYSR